MNVRIIVVLCIFTVLAACTVRTLPHTDSYPFYPIDIINYSSMNLSERDFNTGGEVVQTYEGYFNTEGYVVSKYVCPPCPFGAMCKMCFGPSITISEKNSKSVDLEYGRGVMLMTGKPEEFRVGKKYKFSVHVHGTGYGNMDLIGYDSE